MYEFSLPVFVFFPLAFLRTLLFHLFSTPFVFKPVFSPLFSVSFTFSFLFFPLVLLALCPVCLVSSWFALCLGLILLFVPTTRLFCCLCYYEHSFSSLTLTFCCVVLPPSCIWFLSFFLQIVTRWCIRTTGVETGRKVYEKNIQIWN